MPTSNSVKTVAIIRAGVSGLCAAKYLLEERLAASEDPNEEIFKVVIFEQQGSQAGGVWNQTEADTPFATPMYPACTSIVPTDMMQFSDQTYTEETALFPKNPSVAKYLHEFAQALDARQIIEYDTKVTNVCRCLTPGPNRLKWEVELCKGAISGRKDKETGYFDFLILALGTFTKEYVPSPFDIDSSSSGIEILHSKKYRSADYFIGKKVLIVGDGPASLEMSGAISEVPREGKLLISVKEPESYNERFKSKEVLPKVTKVCHETKKVHFKDGREKEVDIILLCTGYKYDFKIMPRIQMTDDNKRVLDLYEHMLLIDEEEDPTVAIIGLPKMDSVFLVAEAQSAFIARYFSGRIRIPIAQMKSERDAKAKIFDSDASNKNAQFHTLVYPSDARYVDDLFKKCVEAESTGPTRTGKLPQFHT